MSKGDGHGMSFVYDWQLFTEKNREYSHPIGQSKCKTYSIEDYAYIISKKIVVAH